MDLPKLKAIEITLSDGSIHIVHEPKGREGLRAFLSALPALTMLQSIFTRMQDGQNGLLDMSVADVPLQLIDAMYGLLGVMADMTPEEFDEMGVSNQLALLQGFSLFAPKNRTAATPVTSVPSTPMP